MFARLFRRPLRALPFAAAATLAVAPSLAAQNLRRMIVQLRAPASEARVVMPGTPPVTSGELETISNRLERDYRATELNRAPFAGMVLMEVDASRIAALRADPNVALVEEDRLWAPADLRESTPVDRWAAYRRPAAGRADEIPPGVTQVTAPTVWQSGNYGDGVKVAVLDSGGDPTHPDLRYAGGYNVTTGLTTGWNDDVAVCNGHGTHIAGTIAALDNGSGLVGVAPHVQLYAIRVFENWNGSCLASTFAQIAGIQWAVSQGIKLVNVSIGGTYSAGFDSVIQQAAAAGTYVIAAAGNNGGALTYPGSSAYAIGVAAVDGSNIRASWSNFGPEVDISAPGVSINSTMPGGGYGYKGGTSMATPHVVGVAALILAANPNLSFAQLQQKLRDGALDLETAGFDNNTGWGLARAANSIGGATPPPVPLALALSPTSRSTTIQAGGSAGSGTATVTLTGDNNATTAWSATKKKSWTTLTTGSGTGSGTLNWTRNATGLAAGTYVDTLSVTAGAATPAVLYDTLVVTPAPVPLVLAVSPASRNVSVQAGGSAPGSTATVTLTGDNASTTAWSATKRKSWTTLTTGSGTGSGTLAWSRNATGLAAGTYVDTITVTATGATGSPSRIYDTLVVTVAPVPLTLAVSPTSRSTSVQAGGIAAGANAAVTLAGDNAPTTAWSAAKRKSWTTLTTGSGTGSGTLAWSRNATGLAVGTYVDTITVSAAGVPSVLVYDTLLVTAAPVPLTMTTSPTSRNWAVQQGGSAPSDAATITLAGDNASTTAWSATKRKSWTTLTAGSGTGSGVLTWARNATGLAVGTYVDTITIAAAGVPSIQIHDTLRVTAAPVPLTIAVSPTSRNTGVPQGSPAPGGTGSVTLAGDNASTTAWSASKRKSWTTLTSGAGTGNGTVAWNRDATGLAVGTYVDTITIAAGAATPAVIYDTLRITAAPVPLTVSTPSTSRNWPVQQGGSAPSDAAVITLAGDNASTTPWSASKRKSWTMLTSSAGTGSGVLTWARDATGLAVGTYVDTLTVTAGAAAPLVIYDTLRVTATPLPLTLAVAPTSRNVAVQSGGSAPGDQAAVTLTGDNNATAAWSASKRKSWTTLTTGSGTGSGTLAWNRNATGLAVGTYVDTITVTAAGATGSPSTIYDTLRVTAAPVPLTLAVSPGSRSGTVQVGGNAPSDQVLVTLSGTGATSATWTVTKKKSWTSLVTTAGTGTGVLTWNRSATGLAVGTYVDTLTITASGASGSPAVVYDTLRVTAAPVPVTVAVAPGSRNVSVQQGSAAAGDQAAVTLAGDNASTTAWSAAKKKSWTTLTVGSGTGSGTLVWSRDATGLAVGTYVDTITVTAAGATLPTRIVDTLRVTAAPVTPLALSLSATARSNTITAGSSAPKDSVVVSITGTGASSAAWSATKRANWISLTTAGGTGASTKLRWTRNASSLAAGTYVDTIRVTLASTGAVTFLFDTLKVQPQNIAVRPGGKKSRLLTAGGVRTDLSNVAITADSALVEGEVAEGASTLWTASTAATRLRLVTQSGSLNARVVWERLAVDLPVGLHVDTIRVRLQGDPNVETVFVDSLEVVQVTMPQPAIAVEELFRAGQLNDDQRQVLDRDGNRNGFYDIGDFLAWVDRNHITLSAATMARLQELPVAAPAAVPSSARPRPDDKKPR